MAPLSLHSKPLKQRPTEFGYGLSINESAGGVWAREHGAAIAQSCIMLRTVSLVDRFFLFSATFPGLETGTSYGIWRNGQPGNVKASGVYPLPAAAAFATAARMVDQLDSKFSHRVSGIAPNVTALAFANGARAVVIVWTRGIFKGMDRNRELTFLPIQLAALSLPANTTAMRGTGEVITHATDGSLHATLEAMPTYLQCELADLTQLETAVRHALVKTTTRLKDDDDNGAGSFRSVFWSAQEMGGGAGLTRAQYEDQALVFALQGLVNRDSPSLFIDVGVDDFDFPQSEETWRQLLAHGGQGSDKGPSVTWEVPQVAPQLCALVDRFANATNGSLIVYPSDGFSVYVALTMSGIIGHLPASAAVLERHPCLQKMSVAEDLRKHSWGDTYVAHRWSIDNLLPRCNRTLIWDANFGIASRKMNSLQANATLMSVDYAVMQRAFIFNLNPCNASLHDNNGNPQLCSGIPPQETALFVQIVQKSGPLISIYGWSEPENGFTDTASKHGGVSFCTFSTPNLSYWRILSQAAKASPIPLPLSDSGKPLDRHTYYVLFVTNEGDTPRILTSQFAQAWNSPQRGSVPVSWGIDPLLGELFPVLWNAFVSTATANDTW